MTFEEARAQFPVLERVAYLNAGSAGPLPTAAVDAARAQFERDLTEGRSGAGFIEGLLELRERVRGALAAVLGAEAELVALTDSTTRGCQIVVSGLGLGPEDEVVTTGEEHFGLIGELQASGARVVVTDADEEALLRCGDAANAGSSPSRTSSGRRGEGSISRGCANLTARRSSSTGPSRQGRFRST